jgi:hypothetical protein
MNDILSVYYCHLCGAEYVVKYNLQQHLEKEHDEVRKTSCKTNICNIIIYYSCVE